MHRSFTNNTAAPAPAGQSTCRGRRPAGRGRSLLLLACLALTAAATGGARAAAYPLPPEGESVVGYTDFLTIGREDTFAQIAHRYGLGFRELVDANPGVDAWVPRDGDRIELPLAFILPEVRREGIVINLAEYRLYQFGNGRVVTYPVGVGREGLETPLGRTTVVMRIENPSWTPSRDARADAEARGDPLPPVVPPGPDNPLGDFALQLALPGILIHGTNKPFGVGQMVSRGCIRMYPDHIATLIEMAPVGTEVEFVYEPVKVGWRDGVAYVEAHNGPYLMYEELEAVDMVRARIGDRAKLDEAKLTDAIKRRSGIPVAVTVPPQRSQDRAGD